MKTFSLAKVFGNDGTQRLRNSILKMLDCASKNVEFLQTRASPRLENLHSKSNTAMMRYQKYAG